MRWRLLSIETIISVQLPYRFLLWCLRLLSLLRLTFAFIVITSSDSAHKACKLFDKRALWFFSVFALVLFAYLTAMVLSIQTILNWKQSSLDTNKRERRNQASVLYVSASARLALLFWFVVHSTYSTGTFSRPDDSVALLIYTLWNF